ncbi:MAG: glucose-6-phosphate isomerase [Rubrimonas sp.]|uniref:glucose-6-phosphate isomerase n=1 Tax=Rubrimonas sp. TaxID=2036015 RepID=UPI002FDE07AE
MTNADAAWSDLEAHAARLRATTLRALFAADPGRADALSFALDDLTLDFSREKLDAPALGALVALARASGVEASRDAMATGEAVNLTEGRPALHMALRGSCAPLVEGVAEVGGTLDRFLAFADAVRSGAFAGAEGAFADVVNIGIGGSDLGPVMAARALAPDCDGPRAHFVSNVDGAHLTDVLGPLDPARTLVVVASKTFTTQETMTNARTARDWLAASVGERAGAHMAAVSTNLPACAAFGIEAERVFGFWDWVGGRYSLWSAIGLPVAIAAGSKAFRDLLAGAASMDAHFLSAPLARNLPVLLALVGVWRRNAMGWPTVALIPYDQRLERFAAYVQQLDMESNGKRARRDGGPVARATAPVIWGEPGTNAQHSFFQLVHQGTDVIPVDFILAAEPRVAPGWDAMADALADHHAKLAANCLAQASALAFGRTLAEAEAAMAGAPAAEVARLAPHRVFPGDRPSTLILHRRLDAFALGRLIALYEHKVFAQGAIWDVNSFDQWGVELGKQLAGGMLDALKAGAAEGADPATAATVARIAALRG